MPPFMNMPQSIIPKEKNIDVSGFAALIKAKRDKQIAEEQNNKAANILQQADYSAPVVDAFRGGDRGLAGIMLKKLQLEEQAKRQAGIRAEQNKFRMMQMDGQNRRHADNLELRKQEIEQRGNANTLDRQIQQEKLKALRLKGQGVTPKSIAEERTRDQKTNNITQGIEQLASIPKWAKQNDRDFDGAIGPFESSWAGRALGVFDSSEGEVRRKIAGDTEALAAAIKPLIRKPGEGTWTDADQTRLVSVVGDLVKAKDTNEFNRTLAGVRDRINSNFGLNIPQLSFEGGGLDDLEGQVSSEVLTQAKEAISRGADPAKVRARILGGK